MSPYKCECVRANRMINEDIAHEANTNKNEKKYYAFARKVPDDVVVIRISTFVAHFFDFLFANKNLFYFCSVLLSKYYGKKKKTKREKRICYLIGTVITLEYSMSCVSVRA